MSELVERAIDAAGFRGILDARRSEGLDAAQVARLNSGDLLALGALADLVRQAEVGDEVRIYALPPPHDPQVIVLPRDDRQQTGLELLRDVAIARVTGPRGARVRVDFTRCGLELAQVTLGFGANELAGELSSKRGLPLLDSEFLGVGRKSRLEPAAVVKARELAAFVRRAGRTPVFVSLNELAASAIEEPLATEVP